MESATNLIRRFLRRWRATDRLSRLTFGWLAILTAGAGAFALCVVCVLGLWTVQWFFAAPAAGEPPAATATRTAAPSRAATATPVRTAAGVAPSALPESTRAPGAPEPSATRSPAGIPPSATAAAQIATAAPAVPTGMPTAVMTVVPAATPIAVATTIPTATPPPSPTLPGTTFQGSGKQVTTRFALTSGLALFRIRYAGAAPLSVWLVGAGNAKVAPVVATGGGPYSGVRAIGAPGGADYALEVQGDGLWTVNLQQPPAYTSGAALPQSLRGEGDDISGPLALPGSTLNFKINYTGARDLLIWLLDATGSRVTLVTRSSGSYSATLRVAVPEAGIYLVDVSSSGGWTVEISP